MSSDQFSEEIQQKRFEKGKSYIELNLITQLPDEIKASAQRTRFGIIITAQINSELISDLPDIIEFDIHLEGKYPFQAPKIVLKTLTPFPSPSDGRNLLPAIVQGRWSPSITVQSLILNLNEFIQTAECLRPNNSKTVEIGEFHLGHPMYLNTWDQNSMGCFDCVELDSMNPNLQRQRFIAISHSVILQLDPDSQSRDIGYLISWATLQALENIKRSRNDPSMLTFQWKAIGDIEPYSQIFRIQAAERVIELLSRNMHKLGAIVKRENPVPTLKEEDVKQETAIAINIVDVLQAIDIYESNMDNFVTEDMVNSLMELYQKAIEYYSALGDNQFQNYLDKMHYLLSRDSVCSVLQKEEENYSQQLVMPDPPAQLEQDEEEVVEEQKEKVVEEQKEEVVEEQKEEVVEEQKEEEVVQEQKEEVVEEQKEEVVEEQKEEVVEEQKEEEVVQEQKEEVVEKQKEEVVEEQKEEVQEDEVKIEEEQNQGMLQDLSQEQDIVEQVDNQDQKNRELQKDEILSDKNAEEEQKIEEMIQNEETNEENSIKQEDDESNDQIEVQKQEVNANSADLDSS